MNEYWALEELRYDISQRDAIKARLVIDEFEFLQKGEQVAILDELEVAPAEFSLPLVIYLFKIHPEILDKFPEFEKVYHHIATQAPELILEGVKTISSDTIYFIQLAEKTRLKAAAPFIEKMTLQVDDPSFQLAGLSCLSVLEDPGTLKGVANLLYKSNFKIVSAAVIAMSRIGAAEAIQYLSGAMGRNEKLDSLILDICSEVQSDEALNLLSSTLGNASAALRNQARRWLGIIGDIAVETLLPNLENKNNDVVILSLNILFEIRSELAAPAVRQLLLNRPKDPNIRFAAYEALGQMAKERGDYVLAGGLEDVDSNVRLVAAQAVERNLSDSLVAGVKNMVEAPGKETERIVQAILDSQSGKLFLALLEINAFSNEACRYLGELASEKIHSFFVDLLKEEGRLDLTENIQDIARKKPHVVKGTICAVDDSKMILSLYRSIFSKLNYRPVLFDNGMEAISWLKKEKPDILCTDLNMPEMTGIELIQKVRTLYRKEELPIFLVTTQSDVERDQQFTSVDINDLIHKPFDLEMLKSAFSKLT